MRVPPPPRARDAGLTLVEVVVALAIIGVAAGVATFGVGVSDRRIGPEVEARRLAARLEAAADAATAEQRPHVLRWDEDGYALSRAATEDDERGRHALIGGVTLRINDGGAERVIAPEGLGAPFTAELLGRGRAWRVRFDGLGARAAPAEAEAP